MGLPQTFTPEELAEHMGWSPRRVRETARRLAACRIVGNRMVLVQEDVDAIIEASKPCPLQSTNATGGGGSKAASIGYRAANTTDKAQAYLAKRLNQKRQR